MTVDSHLGSWAYTLLKGSFAMKIFLLLLTTSLLTGCSNLLPTSKQDINNQWQSFDDVKKSYDEIIPNSTTMDTVRTIGFDPFKKPNMRILNHSQVVAAVLPSPLQDRATIPQGISDCMQAQEGCIGYLFELSRINRQRVGNFLLDFTNFKRNTHTTGWKFAALIVVINNTVVFKQWSGQPMIDETELRNNPLGPFQGSGEAAVKSVVPLP